MSAEIKLLDHAVLEKNCSVAYNEWEVSVINQCRVVRLCFTFNFIQEHCAILFTCITARVGEGGRKGERGS